MGGRDGVRARVADWMEVGWFAAVCLDDLVWSAGLGRCAVCLDDQV